MAVSVRGTVAPQWSMRSLSICGDRMISLGVRMRAGAWLLVQTSSVRSRCSVSETACHRCVRRASVIAGLAGMRPPRTRSAAGGLRRRHGNWGQNGGGDRRVGCAGRRYPSAPTVEEQPAVRWRDESRVADRCRSRWAGRAECRRRWGSFRGRRGRGSGGCRGEEPGPGGERGQRHGERGRQRRAAAICQGDRWSPRQRPCACPARQRGPDRPRRREEQPLLGISARLPETLSARARAACLSRRARARAACAAARA